ncbi:MAG TPA: beta-ketoacyl synthase N-terminal-like domain-containing protein [Micromonosporaceae bacterium]|nr:beta-ketoacyl synthase N-terminal-like domain-containing protein [Micromonosporaceae bacterium]
MTGVRHRPAAGPALTASPALTARTGTTAGGGTAAGPGVAHRTVISAWSAVSPFGLDRTDLVAGLRDGRRCAAAVDDAGWPAAVGEACLVPGFDARAVLGRKGTRSMDRASALAVAATGQLLRGPDGGRIDGVDSDTALVLGTTTGSTQSMMDFIRDSLVQQRPYLVDPARFPNTAMNCAAAQCAIWHQLRGPNTTVAGGRAAGLLALQYALRLHRSGRAGVVACGAVEELSAARAWLEYHTAPDRLAATTLGEGCAMVLLEPAGRPGGYGRAELAEVLALEFGVYGQPAQASPVLARCLRRAFAAVPEPPDRVWAVASCGGPEPARAAEEAALAEVLGAGARPLRLLSTGLVGDTDAASAMFGLAAVLALAAQAPEAGGRTALLTAVDRDGVVGCALLRLGAPAQERAS